MLACCNMLETSELINLQNNFEMLCLTGLDDELIPKKPFVCPKKGVIYPYIPILFGWDWNPTNPIRSGGVWILRE